MSVFITGAGGYIGGTVALRLIQDGYQVRGLIRDAKRAAQLEALGVVPVIGTLDDSDLLVAEAAASEGVIHTANSDHAAAIEALIEGLTGTGNPLLHTSGSSVIGDDARGRTLNPAIFDEDSDFVVADMKKPRRDIELRVLAAQSAGVRSVVMCPSSIFGKGRGLHQKSVQIPLLVEYARETGTVRYVGFGVNRWSQVHIEDVADLYLLALEKAPAGTYYFIENGEASFFDIGASIALRLGLGMAESLTVEDAAQRWGELHAYYTFGTNSRIYAKHARENLGWTPRHNNVLRWIEREMEL